MKGVGRVFVVTSNDNAATSERLVDLWVSKLRQGERGWDRHNRGRNEGSGVDTQVDIGQKDTTSCRTRFCEQNGKACNMKGLDIPMQEKPEVMAW